MLLGILIQEHIFTPHDFIEFCFSNKNKRNAFEYNLKGFYALFYLLILIIHSGIGEGMGVCHDSVNSKGLFIVRTRLPPRVYSLSP